MIKHLEHYKRAIISVRRSRFRSLMTIIGVTIGICSFIVISSTALGLRDQISRQTNKMPKESLVLYPATNQQVDSFSDILFNKNLISSTFSAEDTIKILEHFKEQKFTPLFNLNLPMSTSDNQAIAGSLIAVNQSFDNIFQYEVESGNYFNDSENLPLAMIGKNISDVYFKEASPIGKSFSINGKEYRVIGVYERVSRIDQLTSIVPDINDSVLVDYKNFAKTYPETFKNYGANFFAFEDYEKDNMNKELLTFLPASSTQSLNKKDIGSSRNNMLGEISVFIFTISAISLLVGGVGITNIMFAIVSERTREIGIRKSIGATSWQIASQFMSESLVISMLGGFLGFILSAVILGAITALTPLSPTIYPLIFGIALVFSLVIGVVSGTLPAIKAARKDPIESLRK